MKLQKLIIHNIASIEDATIDFEAEPLASSEVFLIAGKMGAGKSTILDSICLALYANTPRLSGTQMQGSTSDMGDDITIRDPRQLLRRNTVEAFVSLTFVGSNGVPYEATWSVRRSRNKTDGKLQPKTWQLKNLDTNKVLSGDKDVKPEISVAVGLGFEQFCRTTMLAQGEFTRFLNSEDNDKAAILEKITGVDVYSKIGAKVNEVVKAKWHLWDKANELIKGVTILSDDDVAQRRERLTSIETQIANINVAKNADVFRRDWLTDNEVLDKAVVSAQENLQKATLMVESPDFKDKEKLVNEWNSTIDARRWMDDANKAQSSVDKQREAIDKMANEYGVLLSAQRCEEQKLSGVEQRIVDVEYWLTTQANKKDVYDNVQTVVSRLATIADGRDDIAKNKTLVDDNQKRLDESFKPALRDAVTKRDEAKKDLTEEEERVKHKDDELALLGLSKLRSQRDDVNLLLANIKTANDHLEAWLSAQRQRAQKESVLADLKKHIDALKDSLSELDDPLHDAELELGAFQKCLDKQKDSVDKFAKAMRAKLVVGDSCPVCGRVIDSDLPHDDELAVLVKGLQDECKKAEAKYNELLTKKNKLTSDIESETKAYDRDVQALDKDNTVSLAERKVTDSCRLCGVAFDEHTHDSLDAMRDRATSDKKSLDERINAAEVLESQVKQLRNVVDNKRTTLEGLDNKVEVAKDNVDKVDGDIEKYKALIDSKLKEVDKAERDVSALVVPGLWSVDWHTSPREFSDVLKADAAKYAEYVDSRQKLANQRDKMKVNCGHVANVMEAMLRVMPLWNDIDPSSTTPVSDVLSQATSLSNRLASAIEMLNNAQQTFVDNQSRLDKFLANGVLTLDRLGVLDSYAHADIEREESSLKLCRDAVVSTTTLLENATKQLADHLQNKPEQTDESIEDIKARITACENQIAELTEEKVKIRQQLDDNDGNKLRLDTLVGDANQKKTDYERWVRMDKLIGDATGSKFRKIAQSYVLANLIHSANSYMKTLTDRYVLKVLPGTFVILLEDAYQGYVSRAASTISGGESFLVSLSLALALSDIGQTLSVDTLFIDEGFGTLSGEPLQNAVNTLRTLHSKAGRHVGIISHVEELRERIPVQIRVDQEGHNSSSTITVVAES